MDQQERELIERTAHVHIYSWSRDCDGRYEDERIVSVLRVTTEIERGASFDNSDDSPYDMDGEYVNAILRDAIRNTARWDIPLYGEREVRMKGHDDDGNQTLSVSWDTDEGGVTVVYEGCMNSGCDHDYSLSRDLTAEAAGY